jgi:hypothetical protein
MKRASKLMWQKIMMKINGLLINNYLITEEVFVLICTWPLKIPEKVEIHQKSMAFSVSSKTSLSEFLEIKIDEAKLMKQDNETARIVWSQNPVA